MTTGFKGLVLAAGLAIAAIGGGQALAQANAAAPHSAPASAPQASAEQGGVSNTAPTSNAAPATAAPTSPLLAMDGAPAMLPSADVGHARADGWSIQPQVTNNGIRAHQFHDRILFPLIAAICVLVLGLLVYVVLRYRQAAHPVPSKTSHNTVIEVIWTLAPVLILAAIALPSINLLAAQFKPAPAGAVTLKAIGNQWYWSYQYPDFGGIEITANMLKEKDQVGAGERARIDADGPRLLAADNRVVLPAGVPIRLITTANDVIHSWAVPAFWIKLDAIPGRLNETSFTINKPGLYFGQCSELCGARHAFMPIAVEVVPVDVFKRWVIAKGGTLPGSVKPSAAVIPQPGAVAPVADQAGANAADAATGPVENATTVPATSSQGAARNIATHGNPGL